VSTPRLGPEDAGRTVEVAVGVPVAVALPETGGTGYTWQVEELPDGAKVIAERYDHEPGAGIGATSLHVFEIDPGPGGQLRFVQLRPWEGEAGVLERYEVDVRVTGATTSR
jgi:predicted secreted protein